MILDLDCHALVGRIERGSFRHRPRFQHPIELEPEVIVEPAGRVLLHHEQQRPAALAGLLGRWLGSAREAALGGVAIECARTHSTPSSQLQSESSSMLLTCAYRTHSDMKAVICLFQPV